MSKSSRCAIAEVAKEAGLFFRNSLIFQGWPLIVNGINIEALKWSEEQSFSFDNVEYPSIEDAINHYAQTFFLPVDYFKEVLLAVGLERFAYAVRFCRLLVGTTPNERKAALKNLMEG